MVEVEQVMASEITRFSEKLTAQEITIIPPIKLAVD